MTRDADHYHDQPQFNEDLESNQTLKGVVIPLRFRRQKLRDQQNADQTTNRAPAPGEKGVEHGPINPQPPSEVEEEVPHRSGLALSASSKAATQRSAARRAENQRSAKPRACTALRATFSSLLATTSSLAHISPGDRAS